MFCFFSDNPIADVLELTFSTDDEKFGELRTIDLKPGGSEIPVTDENKMEYVEYVLQVLHCFFVLFYIDWSSTGEYEGESRNNSTHFFKDSMN